MPGRSAEPRAAAGRHIVGKQRWQDACKRKNRLNGILASLGDRRARQRFERLTELALPSLYRAARRLTASQTEAEDLVHDACLKAFEAWRRVELRGPDAHRAWLLRILVNAYRDQYRRRQSAPEIELVGDEADAETPFVERAPSHAPGPERLRSAPGVYRRRGCRDPRASARSPPCRDSLFCRGADLPRDRRHRGLPHRHGDVPPLPGPQRASAQACGLRARRQV